MKKDIKSLIMKPLIVAVFLMLCQAGIAQHPLLSPEELNVYVAPEVSCLVRLGKSASDEGRTCYKWNGYFEEGAAERTGSYQVFLLPDYMAHPGTSYTYFLTVIGEQYYQQEVVLHVVGDITFEVSPIRGCISGNEMPRIEDFRITTNPSGFENLVSLTEMHPHTTNVIDGYYDVFFELRAGGALLDQKVATIINTDQALEIHQVNLDPWGDLIRGANTWITLFCKGLKAVTGSGPQIDIPTIYGGWTITDGFDCCETTMRQKKIDIDRVGVTAGVHLDINAVPFLYGLRAGFRGEVGIEFGLRDIHAKLYNTCGPVVNEYDGGYGGGSVAIGVFLEDITGSFLSATGRVVGNVWVDRFRLRVTGSYSQTYGVLGADINLECKFMFCSFFSTTYTTPIMKKHEFPLVYNIHIY